MHMGYIVTCFFTWRFEFKTTKAY